MQVLARERGGECLSKIYINAQSKLIWKCGAGHTWEALPGQIKQGRWCAVCHNERRKLGIGKMHALARERGGKCLSDDYFDVFCKLTWQCAAGHVWEAAPAKVRRGSWCPTCARERLRLGIEAMQAQARERGGRCLSEVYVNSEKALMWQCAEGHVWESSPANIRKGSWCPVCSWDHRRLGIEKMHALARKHGGRCLSKEYARAGQKLLWECAEGHRWETVPAKVKEGAWCPKCSRERRRRGIEAARQLAREHGGECLSETYLNTNQKLLWRCSAGHVWERSRASVRARLAQGLPWCPQCQAEKERHQHLEAIRNLARSRSGECLSEKYVRWDEKLTWRCAQGHVWQATAVAVESEGCWCPNCAREAQKKYTLADMQAVAERRGGKCLSTEYANTRDKLRWQCEKGHVWEALAGKVSMKTWCPVCSRKKWTIEKMQEIAHERGGRCLSTEYIHSVSKLWWECKQGHRWKSTPASVVQGKSWCPQCVYLDRCKYDHKRRKYLPGGAVASRA